MNTEQERAAFEAWAQNSFELHRHSAGEYSSNFTQTAWAAWQAGRAALQSQEYTSAIGEAGQAYMDSFKYAHPLPVQFRWSELWEVMCAAANEGFPQSQVENDTTLFCDLKTDEEKSAFFLSGRGYETGVIAQAIQNDVAMAYHRCAEYKKELEALQSQDREDAERYRKLRAMATQQADSLGPIFRIDVRRSAPYLFNFDAAIDHARRIEV